MTDILLICLFVLVTGACIGSFLNVVALRAISKESIVFPSSKCPQCNNTIKWYDNIPVLSYLFTFRGKCRSCGCKVSIQYPIVEALTAILFLITFLAFGATLQTLILLILISISIVMIITDFKTECIFDMHLWIFIATCALYSILFKYGIKNALDICLGILAGVFVMETIAKLSYYLVKKKTNEKNQEETAEQNEENISEENKEENIVSDENININDYVEKNKRAFGEGDTYLAAGVGALLGWEQLLVAIALAIIFQAICILPQFFINMYKQGEYRLLTSLSAFIVIAALYWILTNSITLNLFVVFAFIVALIFFAIDVITRLKQTTNEQGFVAIPFGPALIFSGFMMLFYGTHIIMFLKKYIFMIFG